MNTMRADDIKASDEELRVMLEAGFVLRDIGRSSEAEKIFRGVIEMLPSADVPRVALSSVALQQGRLDEALADCEEALRLQPASLYARVHHAEALLFARRREQAEDELRRVIAESPDSPHGRTARALLDAAEMIVTRRVESDDNAKHGTQAFSIES